MDIRLYKYHDLSDDAEIIRQLDCLGFVDDFISCVFTRSWCGVGTFTIVMPNESRNINNFCQADFIKIHDKAAGYINKRETTINEDDNTTTFTGYELKGLAGLRIIQPEEDITSITNSVGEIKHYLLNNNLCETTNNDRLIPSYSIKDYEFVDGATITYNPVYADLQETLENLSITYDNGWYADIEKCETVKPFVRSKNLLCKQGEDEGSGGSYQNVYSGYRLNAEGQLVVGNQYDYYTDYIELEPNQQYYYYSRIHNGSGNVETVRVHLYLGDNHTWQQQIAETVPVSSGFLVNFTTPDTTDKITIRVDFNTSDWFTMLEKAPQTNYQPYFIDQVINYDAICFHPALEGKDCSRNHTAPVSVKDNAVIISRELDTLQSSSYEETNHIPNVAYVAGQGTGADRSVAIVNRGNATKLERYESMIDARDIADDLLLPQRGAEYLAQYGTNISFTMEPLQTILQRYPYYPYNNNLADDQLEIGNYISYIDNIKGIASYTNNVLTDVAPLEITVQITEITEIYEDDGFRLEIAFGYDISNLNDALTIQQSKVQSLLNTDPVDTAQIEQNTQNIEENTDEIESIDNVINGNGGIIDRLSSIDDSVSDLWDGLSEKADTSSLGTAAAKDYTDKTSAAALTSTNTNLITGRTAYYAIYNGLDKTASGYALDARQGKALSDRVPLTLTKNTTGFSISGGTTSRTLTVGANYTLGAACAKGVTDNTSATAVTSSDTNLITGRTLYYAGYTKNTGTVTGVKVNGTTKNPSSGVVDIGSLVTPADIDSEEVSSPVTWNTTNCDTENSSVTIYKIGKIRIIHMQLAYIGTGTGYKTMATIKSGERPAQLTYFPMVYHNKQTQLARITAGGAIGLYGNTAESGTTYFNTVTYCV